MADRKVEIRVRRELAGRVDGARLARVARRTLRAEQARGTVSLYVTNDAEVRALNRRFRATDAATDVLAFSVGGDMPATRRYLGDVAISYERARAQARAARWRVADELDLLAAHGILHLLGYTDETPRARARMWRRQERILGRPIKP